MLSLARVMNYAAITAIQFLLMDKPVEHCSVRELEHMAYETGYLFALDFFPLRPQSVEVKSSFRLACLERSCSKLILRAITTSVVQ